MKTNFSLKMLFAALFVSITSFAQSYLTVTPQSQSINLESGTAGTATVRINCHGSGSQGIQLALAPCSFDEGYQSWTTTDDTYMFPGDVANITFHFQKTVTSNQTKTYKIRTVYGYSCDSPEDKILITVNYKVPTCSLAAPSVVNLSNLSYTGANLSWTNVPSNNGYLLSLKPSSSTNWGTIELLPGQNSFSFSGLTQGTAYDYKLQVRCSNNAYSSSVKTGTFSTMNCNLSDPTLSHPFNITMQGADFSWDNIPGNHGYHLFYKQQLETNWSTIVLPQNTTSYTFNNFEWGTYYDVRIAPLCAPNVVGIRSGTRTFVTNSPSGWAFREHLTIATINTNDQVELFFPTGARSTHSQVPLSKKVDLYSSKLYVGISLAGVPYTFRDGEVVSSPLPVGVSATDISIGRPYKQGVGNNYPNPPVYVLGSNNVIYYRESAYTNTAWTALTLSISSWSGVISNIEANSAISFFIKDSNHKVFRCGRTTGNTFNCFQTYTGGSPTTSIGSSYENHIENPTGNNPSFSLGLLTPSALSNHVNLSYNFSDSESNTIAGPAGEPAVCTTCLIDGNFNISYGTPDNFVFLPNETGYVYANGTGWTAIASNIKDISIGNYAGISGTNVNRIALAPVIKTEISSIAPVGFKVYPNPAKGYLRVSTEDSLTNANRAIVVADLNGRTLLTQQIDDARDVELDVSHFTSGIYVVIVNSGEGTSLQKIVIQN